MVFKLLNDWQSECMYKLSYNMWTEKFQAIPKKFFSIQVSEYAGLQYDRDTRVVVSYLVWHLLLAWIFSTCECGLLLWFYTVTINSRFVLNCTLQLLSFLAYCCLLHIYLFSEMNFISFKWFNFLNFSKLSYCFENCDWQLS